MSQNAGTLLNNRFILVTLFFLSSPIQASNTVGGTVSGLNGSGLTIQNNVADDLSISSNGGFTFLTALVNGDPYDVTILITPTNPNQDCVISNGSGSMLNADITDVIINCTDIVINPGDANGDSKININDVIQIINIILTGGTPVNGSDADGSGTVNIQDVIFTINIILNPPTLVPVKLLNDTGITTCSDGSNGKLSCPQTNYPGQDAQYGLDFSNNDNSDGHAGFSFTKLDGSGNTLAATATEWTCVKDNTTKLIWEVKTDDGLLRDKDWTYTWYNSTGTNDGGGAGLPNGGICFDNTHCDTEKFVQQANLQGLCGENDWRMPTIKELAGLVSFNRIEPSIDIDYFPNTNILSYWSATPGANNSGSAWYVYYIYGFWTSYSKENQAQVRLVRME